MRRIYAIIGAGLTACLGTYGGPTAAVAATSADRALPISTPDQATQALGRTSLVSVREGGARAQGASRALTLSGDGQHVLFLSADPSLLAGETIDSDVEQLYLRDLVTGDNTLVSRGIAGGPITARITAGDLSYDGGAVVFSTDATGVAPGDANSVEDVYEFTGATGVNRLLTRSRTGQPANGDSTNPSISADGLHVAYESVATNLDPTGHYWINRVSNIFRYDAGRDASKLLTEAYFAGGASDADSFDPDISADGSRIAFSSFSSQLVQHPGFDIQIYLYDARAGLSLATSYSDGTAYDGHNLYPQLSADGTHIVYSAKYPVNPSDPTLGGGYQNLYLLDVQAHSATLVTLGFDGSPAYDFESYGTYYATISADGGRVTFVSPSVNLVRGDTNGASDVFGYDAASGATVLLSRAQGGGPANGDSFTASVSADGTRAAYDSVASNLVRGDGNRAQDVFLFAR